MEHRYRAWDRVKKKMSYHVNVYSEGDEWWWAADHVDPDTEDTICFFDDNVGELMQYIGIKDRNGEKVFKDDIIKWYGFEVRDGKQIRPERIWIVEWDYRRLFQVENIARDTQTLEILGNKWENPELMP